MKSSLSEGGTNYDSGGFRLRPIPGSRSLPRDAKKGRSKKGRTASKWELFGAHQGVMFHVKIKGRAQGEPTVALFEVTAERSPQVGKSRPTHLPTIRLLETDTRKEAASVVME